jgi:ABC-type amino acid transport system permease subunit
MTLTTLRKNISHMFFLTIIFLVSAFITVFVFISVHEQVHATILTSYNIPSVQNVYLFTGTTQPLNQTLYDENCNAECHASNNETDVIGYHLAILIFVLYSLFYIRELYKLGITEIKKGKKR